MSDANLQTSLVGKRCRFAYHNGLGHEQVEGEIVAAFTHATALRLTVRSASRLITVSADEVRLS